jgi:hypothetical protein
MPEDLFCCFRKELISTIEGHDLPPGAMFRNCSGLTLGSEQATAGDFSVKVFRVRAGLS